MNENRLKISNPQRIERILHRICQASLQVMIRSVGDATVAVKGRATNVMVDAAVPGVRVSNISDKGVRHLAAKGASVQVEFVMMSTKVIFLSTIISFEQSSIVVSLPSALVSVERRKNARYACTDDLAAFLDLSLWKPDAEDVTTPPFFLHHRRVGGYIAIADLSFGGLCAVTRFPVVNSVLRRGIIDDKAKLVLPMREPIEVGVEVRWVKKIKEHVQDHAREGDGTFMRSYRFGVEFISQSEDVKLGVRSFIQQISQAGAI